ncbi:hypothetical protein Dimus_034118 [Dionaea muscipula]
MYPIQPLPPGLRQQQSIVTTPLLLCIIDIFSSTHQSNLPICAITNPKETTPRHINHLYIRECCRINRNQPYTALQQMGEMPGLQERQKQGDSISARSTHENNLGSNHIKREPLQGLISPLHNPILSKMSIRSDQRLISMTAPEESLPSEKHACSSLSKLHTIEQPEHVFSSLPSHSSPSQPLTSNPADSPTSP